MAGYNRFGSSDEKVNGILSDYGFIPVAYDPLARVLNHRKEYSRQGKGLLNLHGSIGAVSTQYVPVSDSLRGKKYFPC